MKSSSRGKSRAQKSTDHYCEETNWILIAGGALLGALAIRLGFMLKKAIVAKKDTDISPKVKHEMQKSMFGEKRICSRVWSFSPDEPGCFACIAGGNPTRKSRERAVTGENADGNSLDPDVTLLLATIPISDHSKENRTWPSSPDQIYLPEKTFHQSNSSGSSCISESGSDIFSRREVIQRLRIQLKKRDDMIVEMQSQMMELQNSLARSSYLQSLVDAANRDLFDSEREIQRLRKAIADHCLGHTATDEVVEMLKGEVGELKKVVEEKEYFIQSYREQNTELTLKLRELRERNIM